MKNVKNLKLKLGLIIVALVLMIVQISPFSVYGDEKELPFSKEYGVVLFKNDFYGSNVPYANVRIGNYAAYCVDWGLPLPVDTADYTGTVKLVDRDVSVLTTSVLYYGYPTRTAAEIGVANDEEAELATQIAVWAVVAKSTDSVKAVQEFALGDLVTVQGKEVEAERVKNAVKRIIDTAMADPYSANPAFNINSSSIKITVKDDYMMAGPYELKVTGGFEGVSIKVSLSNAPKSAVVCDANGNAKTTFKAGEQFYVKMSKYEDGSSLTINATANGNIKVAKIYGTGVDNDNKQDFALLKEKPVQLEDSIKLKWSTLKGNLEVYKIDQYGNRIANVKFELKDSNGDVVDTKTTDSNGYISFTDLKIGTYTITEVSAPEGYEMVAEPFSVTVNVNETVPVTFKNRKMGTGSIKILKIEYKNPDVVLQGAKFNLLDENGEFIKSGVTDEKGVLIFDKLAAGKYQVVETEAPNGYIKPNNVIELDVEENVVKSVSVPNLKINGELRITKLDSDKNPIEGVTFEIYDENEDKICTITTDDTGYASTKTAGVSLNKGTYYYKEVDAPYYVIKNTELQKFVLENPQQVVEVTVENKLAKGVIKIIKQDEEGNKLSGVKFDILDENKKLVQTITTDENGVATTDELLIGTYYYKETSELPGMIVDSSEVKIELVQGEVAKTVVNYYQKGKLTIEKVDTLGNKIEGVKFEIYAEDKTTLVDTIITDKEGNATTKDLKLGTYYYKEVDAPDYVIMDSEPVKFTLTKNGQTINRKVKNELVKANLIIEKVTEDGKPLAGVTFEILDKDNKVVDKVTTNEKGIATSKNLDAGTYYYQEVDAPSNVKINKQLGSFTIAHEEVRVKVVNEYAKGTLKIVKTDSNGNLLEGVKFEIYAEDKTTLVETIVTDKDGIAISSKLVLGTYYYKEVEAPNNVIKDESLKEFKLEKDAQVVTKEVVNELVKSTLTIEKVTEDGKPLAGVTFEILDKDGKVVDKIVTDKNGKATTKELAAGEYTYKEVDAPNNVKINSTENKFTLNYENLTVKVVNEYARGTLKIVKTDSNGNLLEGVKFEIYAEDKTTLVETIVTDKDGIAISSKLLLGTYYYKEVEAPNNVIKDESLKEFKLEKDAQVVTKEVVNELVKSTLTIEKVTEDGKPLAGVTFEILDKDGKVVDKIVTDKNGKATTKELAAGEYTYKEVKVPSNIKLDSTEKKFTLAYENITVEVVNKYALGSIKIVKTDSNNKLLEGVKFEIYAEDKTTLVETIVTDKEGVATLENLKVGTYYYKEVEAPEYVVIDSNLKEVKITKDNEVVTIDVVNKIGKGNLKIVKLSDEGEKLANVTFQILNSNREVVDTIVTDENGIAMSKDLECGTYYYREDADKVPVKVIPDTTEHEFTIEKQGQIIQVEVINKVVKGSLKIVKTDDLNTPLEGVVFQVLNANKEVIEEITTDKDGIAVSSELRIGKYYYKEIKAPENVIMNEDMKEFIIDAEAPVVEAKVVNTRICGKIIITKLDKDTKAPIENVTFQILNENKEVIDTIVTDKNGIARIGDLTKGTYYYKEIDAPDVYIMASGEYKFEINKDVQTIEATVYNEHKKLPQTGGFISTNLLIVIIVATVSIAGYVIYIIIRNKKSKGTNA